jgi:hypothetical protein
MVLVPGRWQHLAVVGDGRQIALYLDGKEVARGPGTAPLVPNSKLGFQIGNGYHEQRCFNGAIDDVRIYARCLTLAEIGRLAAGKELGAQP